MSIPLIVLGAGIVMMICEVARPGRSWPQVAGWWTRAALLNGLQGVMVFIAGVTWDRWLIEHRLWSADTLAGQVRVRLEPIPGTPGDLPRVLEPSCQ
jgi:hypothetical protein